VKYFYRRALEFGATAMEGRNHGNSWSIYFEDPEGNRIEIYAPTPWYVRQPCRVPLDVTASNEEIEAATMALIEGGATWRPVETWQAELAGRIARAGGGGERGT
jgi:catechol 2,3-dioxygenase